MNANKVVRLQRVLDHQKKVLEQKAAREGDLEIGARTFFEYLQRASIEAARKDRP